MGKNKTQPEPEAVTPAASRMSPGEVRKLGDALDELGYRGTVIKAEELVDKTFVLRRVRPYRSRFEGQDQALFCWCAWPDTGEAFTTTLGGVGVMDTLDFYLSELGDLPVQVTLRKQEGGSHGWFYVLE